MVASQSVFAASLPELYERFLVAPLFTPFALELVRRAGIAQNDRLLDVACGTGIVARLAHEAAGECRQIVGVDASPNMLAIARTVAPTIDWREGNAAQLPVNSDERFDVVTCHQGLQFFTDKPAAARAMRRVLAPGGRLAVGTWLPVEDIPLVRDLQSVAEQHLGTVVDQRHSFGDADAIRELLTDAGFVAIQIETVTRTIRMSDGATVFPRLNSMAIVGMSAAGKTMTEEQRAQVISDLTNDSVEILQPYLEGSELVFDLSSTIAIARA